MTPTPTQRVTANVRAELARAGVSHATAAQGMGLALASFRRRLYGEVDFTVNEVDRLAAFLGVPPAALLLEGRVAS